MREFQPYDDQESMVFSRATGLGEPAHLSVDPPLSHSTVRALVIICLYILPERESLLSHFYRQSIIVFSSKPNCCIVSESWNALGV